MQRYSLEFGGLCGEPIWGWEPSPRHGVRTQSESFRYHARSM